MTSNDPYEVLGLGKDATPQEINAAYKAAAKKAHPDQGGTSEDFTRVKQASMVLLDPRQRKKFDETGEHESTADNAEAAVMEAIASFLISTINGLEEGWSPNLEQTDLIGNAKRNFADKIKVCEQNIQSINKQIRKLERALKRLKTKRKNDVIRAMISRHIVLLQNVIPINDRDIATNKRAIEILNDYEFDHASPMSTRPTPSGLFSMGSSGA